MQNSDSIEIARLKRELAISQDQLNKAKAGTERMSKIKTQFLANMSHEIRTPLNGIVGMLNLLKSQNFNAKQLSYIETAEHSANHLMSLVNMILDHSKLETNEFVLDKYQLNLKREVKNLSRIFEYRSLDKNIQLKFSVDPDIKPHVLGDNIRLNQVLINFLDNAVKFTDNGEVSLKTKLISTANNIQIIEFKVSDSGIGIDINDTKNIIKAFKQKDLTINRKYGGTGLGLTISNQLIEIMGGTLSVESNLGKGSCFRFQIPLEIDTEKRLKSANEINELKVPTDFNSIKVLIAEDNLINQKVIINFLKRLNIKGDVAENGVDALELYNKNEYDFIFMDIHMPKMNGYEATTEIKSSQKYKETPIPIMAVTASAFDEDKKKALSHGMHDFITKPIIFNKLQETIFKYMSDEFKS